MVKGQVQPLTEAGREKFARTIETLASGGERILGFAQLEFDDDTDPTLYNIEAKNYPQQGERVYRMREKRDEG